MEEPSFRQQVDGPPPPKRRRTASHNQRAIAAGSSPPVVRKSIDNFARSVISTRAGSHPWDRSVNNPMVVTPILALAASVIVGLGIYTILGWHISVPLILVSIVIGAILAILYEVVERAWIGDGTKKRPGVDGSRYLVLAVCALGVIVLAVVVFSWHYTTEQNNLSNNSTYTNSVETNRLNSMP